MPGTLSCLTKHMDEVTIEKIAAEVARHLPSYAWVLLLVQVVVLAAAAAVGAFFGEYLKTRGKNLATTATMMPDGVLKKSEQRQASRAACGSSPIPAGIA